MRRWLSLALLALLMMLALAIAVPLGAAAQPKPRGAAKPAEDPKMAEAKQHFERGLVLLEKRAWDPALAEFLKSRELAPRPSSTENAAVCLRELHRYDEALELYELVLAFPEGDAAAKLQTRRAIEELRRLVGTVALSGAAGASISIDGRDRGAISGAIRISAGTHTLRAYKPGFTPYETRIVVAGEQTVGVVVRLEPLGQAGRVRIVEQDGKSLGVFVDNALVGRTPWEGDLGVGAHLIVLRGEGNIGSQPVAVNVGANATTPVTIRAEELDALLRIEPTPPGAAVAINGVSVGLGVWEGRLRSGEHQIEVTAEGFVRDSRSVKLEAGKQQSVLVRLDRDLTPPGGKVDDGYRPLVFELVGGLGMAPSFGGATSATEAPGVGPSVQLNAAFQTRFDLMLGLAVGYLLVPSVASGKSTTIAPVGQAPDRATIDDARTLQGLLVGGSVGWRFGRSMPITLRATGGAFISSFADDRTGSVRLKNGTSFTLPGQTISTSAVYGFVAPEARIGYRFARHFEASLGFQVVVLIGSRPEWDPAKTDPVSLPGEGRASFGRETVAGSPIAVFVPGLGLRYEL